MTAPNNTPGDSTEERTLTLLKGLLLAAPAAAALAQLVVWILDFHCGSDGIRWILTSAILVPLIGIFVSAAAVGYRPTDNLLWYGLILNLFVAMQGMLLFLMAYIIVVNLLRGVTVW